MLLLLGLMWIFVLKNHLWKSWLTRRYGTVATEVAAALGLVRQEDWWARLAFRGRQGLCRIQVKWMAGTGPHRVAVVVRKGWKRRRWISRPDAPAGLILQHARRLLEEMERA